MASLAKKNTYYIPPCGDGTCVNGPATIETYCLCDICAAKSPDAFDHGKALAPLKWRTITSNRDKKTARKNRKSTNIVTYTAHIMNTLPKTP